MTHEFELGMYETNGVTLRAAVAGDGPLVLMVHGWPELWYSWRHQIGPIADAGYRVVAADMRGYGGSDKPHAVEAYDMATMMADIVGLIDAFGAETAILVGHDWGAPICWNTAALHPSRVAAVAGLSVPYARRGKISPIRLWRELYAGKFFYQLYFQDEGVAEAEFEADVGTALRKIYFSSSGDARISNRSSDRPADSGLLYGLVDPTPFPSWLEARDIDYFVENFTAGGFRGPLNRYRNQDRDFDMLPDMGVKRIGQPSCFIAGARDPVRAFIPGHDMYKNVGKMCDDFRSATIIEGAGHWVQQEAPDAVTAALQTFLASLP